MSISDNPQDLQASLSSRDAFISYYLSNNNPESAQKMADAIKAFAENMQVFLINSSDKSEVIPEDLKQSYLELLEGSKGVAVTKQSLETQLIDHNSLLENKKNLDKELDDLKSANSRLNDEVELIKKDIETQNNLIAHKRGLEEKRSELMAQQDNLKSDIDELTTDIDDVIPKKISTLVASKKEQEVSLNQLKCRLKEQEEKNAAVKRQCEELDGQVANTGAELADAQKEEQKQLDQLQKLRKDLGRAQSELKNHQKSQREIETEINQTTSELKRLPEDKTKKSDELSALKEQLQNEGAKLLQLTSSFELADVSLQEKQSEVSILTKNVGEKESELQLLEVANTDKQNQLNNFNQAIDEHNKKRDDISRTLQIYQAEQQHLGAQLTLLNKILTAIQSNSDDTVETLYAEYKQVQLTVFDDSELRQGIELYIERTSVEMELVASFNDTSEQLRERLGQMGLSLGDMQAGVSEGSLREQLEHLAAQKTSIEESFEKLNEEVKKMRLNFRNTASDLGT